MTAARTGSVRAVTALLESGADVNAREGAHGQTALMWATAEGHLQSAQVLIDRGADVNAQSHPGRAKLDGGFSALLFAVREGNLPLVRLLLNSGADLNAVSSRGANALIVATVRGHVNVATFLLDRAMNANFAGPGYTALHWACGTWESITTHDYPFADVGEWKAMGGIPTRAQAFAYSNFAGTRGQSERSGRVAPDALRVHHRPERNWCHAFVSRRHGRRRGSDAGASRERGRSCDPDE